MLPDRCTAETDLQVTLAAEGTAKMFVWVYTQMSVCDQQRLSLDFAHMLSTFPPLRAFQAQGKLYIQYIAHLR